MLSNKKEYHRADGFDPELYDGAEPDAQHAEVAVRTACGGVSSRNRWPGSVTSNHEKSID